MNRVPTLVLRTSSEQNDLGNQSTDNWCALFCSLHFVYFASQLIVLLLFWWWHFSVNASLHYSMVRLVTDVSKVLLVTHNTRHLNVAKSSNAKHPPFRENHNPDPFVCFEAMKTFDVFFTPGYILRCAATRVVTGHVMSWEETLPDTDTLTSPHDIVKLGLYYFATINSVTQLLNEQEKR